MRRFRFLVPVAFAIALGGCPQGPEENTGEACLGFEECGGCAAQPQCGWCMEGGAGTCVPARSETDRDTPPDSCAGAGKTWHSRIPDHPSLEGPPYCPRVPSPAEDEPAQEQDTSGDEVEMEEAT